RLSCSITFPEDDGRLCDWLICSIRVTAFVPRNLAAPTFVLQSLHTSCHVKAVTLRGV
ncbi:uncharacterized, partial [Tachysurus ichikawai]